MTDDTNRLAALASATAPRSRISATVADLKHALASAPAGDKIVEALAWYGEQARLCRLIHSEGDAGRHALSEDGGKRAAEALAYAPADRSAAYDRLERHLDENYYAGARDDLRQVASAPAADGAASNAIDLLRQYADFIRSDVKADDLERHPYVPTIDQAIADLEALARPRAAVGEREAIAQRLSAYRKDQADEEYVEVDGGLLDDAILALQSPPAKVEGE